MSQRTALVVCRDCAGTGDAKLDPEVGYIHQCHFCLGQGHMLVMLARDGGIPDGEREWKSPKLGPVPHNPLRLTYRAV
jgi:hypothetical protein